MKTNYKEYGKNLLGWLKWPAMIVMAIVVGACSNDNEDLDRAMQQKLLSPALKSRLIAHRGSWLDTGYQENTVDAVRHSCDRGFKYAEVDVRQTLDSVLVLSHDEFAAGYEISQWTYDTLDYLCSLSNYKIDRLEDLLDFAADVENFDLLLEIKDADQKKIESMVNERDLQERVMYISFHPHLLNYLRKQGYSTALLWSEKSMEELKADGYTAIDYSYSWISQHPEWIEQAHDLDMQVITYTLNTQSDIITAFEMDIDFVTTNLVF